MPKAILKIYKEIATARDIGSWIATTWYSAGQMHQGPVWYDVQVTLATAANMRVCYATESTGAAVAASCYLNQASNLLAECMYGFSFMAKGSTYFNLAFGATTTIKSLYLAERMEW